MRTVTLTLATLLLAASAAGANERTTSIATTFAAPSTPSTNLAILCHRWGLCAPRFTPPPIFPKPIVCPPNAMCAPLPLPLPRPEPPKTDR